MRKKLAFTFLACLVSAAPAAGAEDLMDPALYSAGRRGGDLGLNYLRNAQCRQALPYFF